MDPETTDLVDEIIADYIRSEEAGQPRDRDQLIAENPAIADELQEFFADRERFRRLAPPLDGDAPRRQFVPPAGRSFADYELLDEIARGGMGVVYKARQTSLNRIVAIKMILAGNLATEDDMRRFHTEAESAANLQHPNIVSVHEVGDQAGHQYFSMDYVEGQTLAEISGAGPLEPRDAARYVLQAAVAIEYAHQQGVLHRDIKPSNMLIDQDDQVRITDFGLAGWMERSSSLTRTGQALGTPGFMPPEQAAGRKVLVGPPSDVYGLGAVLYTLLTGNPPFHAPTPAQTLQQVLHAEPESPRAVSSSVSKDLETICLKCLEKEPHRRYGTAGLLAEDLERFLEGKPIAARPLGRAERSWRWCRRNRALAGLGTLAAGLLGVLSATLLVTAFVDPDPIPQPGLTSGENSFSANAESAAAAPVVFELQERRGLQAHRWGAVHLALSPDGKLLATGSEEDHPGMVRLWDFASGRLVGELYGHEGCIYGLAFSPDGRHLATGSRDFSLRLWDIVEQKTLHIIENATQCREMRFSANGQILFTGAQHSGTQLQAWNVDTAELIQAFDTPSHVTGLTVAPDGRSLVVGYRQADKGFTLEILGLPLGDERTPITGRSVGIEAVAYSPDGRFLATGGEDGTATLWDPQTGQPKFYLRDHPHRIKEFAFSPDSSLVAVLSETWVDTPPAEIHIWDTQTGERVAVAAQDAAASTIVFTPTGDALISGDHLGRIRVWQLSKNGQPYGGRETLVGLGQPIQPSQVDGDWRWGRGLSLERTIEQPSGEAVDFLAVTVDGQNVISTGEEVLRMAELASGEEVETFALPKGAAGGPMAVSGDGRLFVAPSEQTGELELHDLQTGEMLRPFERVSFPAEALTFTPDDRLVLACGAGEDTHAAAWDVASGERLYSVPLSGSEPRSMSVSPDNRYFTIADGGQEVTLREVQNGQVVHRLAHAGAFVAAFAPDGKQLLTCPRDAGTLRLWAVQTGEEVDRFLWSNRRTDAAVWLPGQRAVIASEGSFLRLVDLETGNVLCRIKRPAHAAEYLAATPDGRHVISAGGYRGEDDGVVAAGDMTVRVWRVEEPSPAADRDHSPSAMHTIADGKTFWTGVGWPTAAELRHLPGSKRLRFEANGNEYQRIDLYGLSWRESEILCELLGGHLATVTSAEENDFLHQNFTRDHIVWLGGTDQEREGQWRWVTGEPFTFLNWARNEPSGMGGAARDIPEHYLDMGMGPQWNDRSGHGRSNHRPTLLPLCEWDAPQSDDEVAKNTTDSPASTGKQNEELSAASEAAVNATPDEALREMRRRFLALAALGQWDGIERKPIKQPLYRFADETRDIRDGSIWGWGGPGRPLALAGVQQDSHGFWSYELMSLSSEPDGPAVVTEEGWRWAPSQPGLQFVSLDAPSPPSAANDEQRLAEMLLLARRFEVSQATGSGSRQQLELLSEPFHRFSDPDKGLSDGAIFAYADGMYPAVLLVVECHGGPDVTHWRYAFAPLTSASVEAKLNGKTVWTMREGLWQPKTQDPYTLIPDELAAEAASSIERLDRLGELPEQWRWYSARMKFCREVAQDDELFAAVRKLRPDEDSLWIARGQVLALANQWQESVDAYSHVDSHGFQRACLHLLTGQPDVSRTVSVELIASAGEVTDPNVAYNLARTCILVPDMPASTVQVVNWAALAVRQDPRAVRLHILGVAYYRAGLYPLATESLRKSNDAGWSGFTSGLAQNTLVSAMIYQQLGEPANAEAALIEARDLMAKAEAPPPMDWLEFHVLLQEAEMLIQTEQSPEEPVQTSSR